MGTYSEQFISRVEAFLKASGLKATEFGAQSIGDPNFVLNLRRSRSPILATADRVLAFISRLESETAAKRRQRGKP